VPLYLEPLPGDLGTAIVPPVPGGTAVSPAAGWTAPRGGASDAVQDPYLNYRWTSPRTEAPVR
jgi:hypothetical protein